MAHNRHNDESAFLDNRDVAFNAKSDFADLDIVQAPASSAAEFGMDLIQEGESSAELKDIRAENATGPIPVFESPLSNEEQQMANREVELLKRLRERKARQSAATTLGTLISALNLGASRKGVIHGVSIHDGDCFWEIYQDGIVIQIPYGESYTTLPEDLNFVTGPEILRKRQAFLSKSLGAEIDFILTGHAIDPQGIVTFSASRRQALAKKRRRYFGRRANPDLKIQEGSLAVGRVISASAFVAYLEVGGVDIRIPNFNLSHRFIENVPTSYPVNTEVILTVTKLTEGAANALPEMECSALPIELEDLAANKKFIKVGTSCMATVVSLQKRGEKTNNPHVLVRLWLDGLNYPAFSRSLRLSLEDELHTGDKVYFHTLGIASSEYAHGAITYLIHSY